MMRPGGAIASLKEMAFCAILNHHSLMSDPRYGDWKRLFRCHQCLRKCQLQTTSVNDTSGQWTVFSLETLAFCALLERPPKLELDARYGDWRKNVFRCRECVRYHPLEYRKRGYLIDVCNCMWRCGVCEWKGDVDLVMSQTDASKERASKALLKWKGDIVDAIIELTVDGPFRVHQP